ncbi:MAG: hypothetical protein H0W81_12915 [Chloroflexi bacterium]|nr:hypothetical protein [Chloroflexota bacterium]
MNVCRMHGAGAKQVKAAAARRVARDQAIAAATTEMARLGGAYIEIDPLEGLLSLYQEAEWNVAVLRVAISELRPEVNHDDAIALPEQVIEFEKGGTHVPAQQHVLVAMYNAERDRAAKYAKLCLDAGVEERRVKVAEGDAHRLGRAFAGALDDVAELLNDEARAALRQALGVRLRELAA